MEVDRLREAADQLTGEIGKLLGDISGSVSLSGSTTLGESPVVGRDTGEGAIQSLTGRTTAPAAMSSTGGILPVVTRVIQPVLQAAAPQSGPAGWLSWLNPITALLGLFGGSKDDETSAIAKVRVASPLPVNYTRGIRRDSDWRPEEVDFAADGRVRPINGAAAPSVVVQVQAIDSRSFLDHSDAIADAVKKSLLESHTLAETVREL